MHKIINNIYTKRHKNVLNSTQESRTLLKIRWLDGRRGGHTLPPHQFNFLFALWQPVQKERKKMFMRGGEVHLYL